MKFYHYTIVFASALLITSHTQTGKISQQDIDQKRYQHLLYSPIKFHKSGLNCFLRHIFNDKQYPDFFMHDMRHMTEFLQWGKDSSQQRAYVKSVFRLFDTMRRKTYCFNAWGSESFLEKLPNLIEDQFVIFKSNESVKITEMINDILYSRFLTDFTSFQQNPNLFFDTLSQEIIKKVNNQHEFLEEVTVEEMRKIVIVFLEGLLNKLVWSPKDSIQTWDCVKKIGTHLHRLYEKNIIVDPEDLNGMYISLVERYCFFIDLSGAELPVSFFENIKKEINTVSLPFLELEEQERFLESKKERLMRALTENEAKARAREYGVITT